MQKLIYLLKYEGNKGAGIFLGKQLAYAIEESLNFNQDDIVTTGATLDACAQKLLEVPGVKVSVATIAVA